MSKKKRIYKNPVCAIAWLDATYTFKKKFSKELAHAQVTTGFVIEANDEYTNIATNVNYNLKTGELWPVDGFIIPKGAQLEFRKIVDLNDGNGKWKK